MQSQGWEFTHEDGPEELEVALDERLVNETVTWQGYLGELVVLRARFPHYGFWN